MLARRAQTRNDFGRDDLRRTEVDFIADTVLGKTAEVLFSAFALQFGVTVVPDFDVWDDQHTTDRGQDIASVELSHRGFPGIFTNTFKVDVKATTFASKWLLIEKRKFGSNAFVLVKVNAPKNWEDVRLNLRNLNGEVVGFAYWVDFFDSTHNVPWFNFKQGNWLYHPDEITRDRVETPEDVARMAEKARKMNARIRSPENMALPVHWLRNSRRDWEEFFDIITVCAI